MINANLITQTTTKIYSYAAKPKTLDKPGLEALLTDALGYKNKLIAIERDRRHELSLLLRAHSAPIRQIEDQINKIDEEIDELTKAQRKANSSRALAAKKLGVKTIQRVCGPETKAKLKDLRAKKKGLRANLKAVRQQVRSTNTAYKAARKKVNDRYDDKIKSVRKASSVYPPTKDLIEKDVKFAIKNTQRPPKSDRPSKKKWIWESHPRFVDDPKRRIRIGDRYTKSGPGISTDDVMKGTTKLSIESKKVTEPGTRRPRVLGDAVATIHLWSVNRKAVSYEIPIKFHRPLPKGAVVKQATLVRFYIGSTPKWKLQICVEETRTVMKTAIHDQLARVGDPYIVGLDLGWRMMPGGRLRVATLADNHVAAQVQVPGAAHQFIAALDANSQAKIPTGGPVEIALPPGWVSEMRTVERIQANRDSLKNQLQASLIAFKNSGSCPDWLLHQLQHVDKWRDRNRYLTVYDRWKQNRSKGDDVAFGALEAWAKRDQHLWAYEANLRDQLQCRRMHYYRVIAAQLADRYQSVILEGDPEKGTPMDLRDWQADLPVEDAARQAEVDRIKKNMRYACLHSFRRALSEKLNIIIVDPKNTSKTCSWCGSNKRWQKPAEVEHTCADCGRTWDRDVNAARNLVLKHLDQLPSSDKAGDVTAVA